MTRLAKCVYAAVLLCLSLSLCGQHWRLYTNTAAKEREDIRALLANDSELRNLYSRYSEAADASSAEWARFVQEDNELPAIDERLQKTQEELEELRRLDIGGNELERKSDLLATLRRMRRNALTAMPP